MIITIANSKGGSGKSTITINLATKLALEGKDVLVIDTDEQKSVEKFSNIRNSKELAQRFEVVCKGGNALADTIKSMSKRYDDIVIDTKATINNEQRKAMLLSDYLIIPTTTSQIDLSELLNMFGYVSDVKDLNDTLKAFVVLNRINPNPFLTNEPLELKEFIAEYKAENGFDDVGIFESIIGDRMEYKRSIANGIGVCELDNESSSKSALNCKIEFNKFYDEFMQKINE